MKEEIRFGTAFAIDGLGFIRRGTIELVGDQVVVSGPRHWSTLARVGLFVIFAMLTLIIVGVVGALVLSLLVLTLIHYIAASRESLRFPCMDIAMPASTGEVVTMHARDPRSKEHVKCIFRAKDPDTAARLVAAIKGAQAPA